MPVTHAGFFYSRSAIKSRSAEIERLLRLEADRLEFRRTLIFVLSNALFYTAIVFPYKDIIIPHPIMAGMGVCFGFFALRFCLEEYHKIILMYVIYIPFQKLLPGGFGNMVVAFNMTNIFLFFMLMGWASQTFLLHKAIYKKRVADFPLFLFMFLSSISLIRGEILHSEGTIVDAVFVLKRWLEPMLLYYIVVNNLNDRNSIKWVVLAVCLMDGLVGFLGVKEYYIDKGGLWNEYRRIERARIKGIACQPNQLGAYYCYYTFYLYAFLLANLQTAGYRWLIVPILLCGRAMLLTFSRGATLSFAVASYVTLLLWNRNFGVLILTPFVLFCLAFPDYIPDIIIGRLDTTIKATHDLLAGKGKDAIHDNMDKSAKGRLNLWYLSIVVIKKYPAWGVGMGNFNRVAAPMVLNLEAFMGSTFWDPKAVKDAHNTYLKIAVEMGIPTLVVFFVVLFLLTREAWWVLRRSEYDKLYYATALGYIGGMTGLIVSNLFGFRLNSNEVCTHFWIMSAVIVRIKELIQEETAAAETSSAKTPPVRSRT